jgi:undecaprenyl diphosphate synthase
MEKLIEKIQEDRLPKHIAIIMDGNGRWARKKGLLRIKGHKNGVKAVRDTVETAAKIGISHLTLYAFSTENWKRPKEEVDALMTLLIATLKKELETLTKNAIRLNAIGQLDALPAKARRELDEVMTKTAENSRMTVHLALSYSSRWEIVEAAKRLARKVSEGELNAEDITADTFESSLTTAGIPDPELMIRTSGEQRISNYLLYQLAYTELYFTDVLWPDFRGKDLIEAILDYQGRERRFGKTSDQIKEVDASN